MTNRFALARECLQVEQSGCSVLEFLKQKGYVSPWGTWFRLQKEELERTEGQITDGRGKRKRMANLTLMQKKRAVQMALDGKNPLDFLREIGISNPASCWLRIKKGLMKADPELYARLPDKVPVTRKSNKESEMNG